MRLQIVKKKVSDSGVHFLLNGDMTIYSIRKLKEILLKELKGSSGLSLDLSGVNEADTSAFQLLLFLKREAEVTGRDFIIENPTQRLQSILSLYKETI